MKSLAVSTAFRIGMKDDEVRILGRWRSIATAQHYREVDDSTLLNIFSRLLIQPNLSDSHETNPQQTQHHSSNIVTYPLASQHPHMISWATAHSDALNRELIIHLLISAGFVFASNNPSNRVPNSTPLAVDID